MTMNRDITDHILLQGMIFHSHVGVLDSEKQNGQDFEVDVTIHCRRLPAVENDQLSETIDYSQAFQVIRQIVEDTRCDLIERLAGLIAESLFRRFALAEAVEITIRKPHAPIDGRFTAMGVNIFRERSC